MESGKIYTCELCGSKWDTEEADQPNIFGIGTCTLEENEKGIYTSYMYLCLHCSLSIENTIERLRKK